MDRSNGTWVVAIIVITAAAAGCGKKDDADPSAVAACTPGTWSTVEDYQYAAGANASANSITKDSSGNLYVAGTIEDGGIGHHCVVQKSTDKGATWTKVVDVGSDCYANAVAVDSDGNIYVGGQTLLSIGDSYLRGYAFSGLDSGKTTYFPANLSGYQNSSVQGLGLNSQGKLFMSSYVQNSSGQPGWATFSISVPAFSDAAMVDGFSNYGTGYGIAVDSSDNVYVAGWAHSGVDYWIVQKSTDGGTTWTGATGGVGDAFTSSGAGAKAFGIGLDGTDVYAVGYGSGESSSHWLVRESSNGGTSWTSVDDYSFESGKPSVGVGFAAASDGTLYVGGHGQDASGKNHWIVRTSSRGANTSWSGLDDFQYAAGQDSTPNAVTTDSAGNVYVAGTGTDSSGKTHWLVRKYGCN